MVRIKVILYGLWGSHTGKSGRSEELMVSEGTTVKEVVNRLEVPSDMVGLIAVNGEKKDLETEIRDGDLVTLFPFVAGG